MRSIWWGILAFCFLDGFVWAGSDEAIERIGFGSCYKPEKSTEIWSAVKKFEPQLWLWLGDNFYNDFVDGKYIALNNDPQAFVKGYAKLKSSQGMEALQGLMPDRVMATWDDHDYGKNDAGKEYPRKEEARKAFVKFWGSADQTDGVYSSKDWGPAGKCVRVIMLDLRSQRDPLPKKGQLASDGDMLGEKQWLWLKKELSKPGADLVVIGSSIQFVAEKHRFEKWANFPKCKGRVLKLIGELGVKGVLFISGDRHNGEISCQMGTEAGYPIYDFTSSGLTEVSSITEEENPSRVGHLVNGQNFGALRIDWSTTDPLIVGELRRVDGTVAETVSILLSQLAPPKR